MAMESMLTTEFAIFSVGILGMLLLAAWMLKNWAAGVMWSISSITLIFAGLFNVGIELFWLSIVGTFVLLAVGMIVRWMA